ncbi:hypothetical protein QP64_00100, partial [Staphylococcus aureus]
ARLKAANLANDLVVVEPVLVAKLGHEAPLAIENMDASQVTRYASQYKDLFYQSLSVDPANRGDNEQMVSAQSLKVGDIVRIDAGSSIISDGILLSDSATVSESLLTGESDLIVKRLGDNIVGGSQNDSQPFVMQITTLPNDSQMGVIDRLV